MLDAIIGLFRPKPEPAKKREWSIRDDMRVRAKYAFEVGSNALYVTPEEYQEILTLDETRVYISSSPRIGVTLDDAALYCFGLPVYIKRKED